jgi:hypothetical protein
MVRIRSHLNLGEKSMATLRPRVAGGDGPRSGRDLVGARKRKDDVISAIVQWIPVEVIAVYETLLQIFKFSGPSLAYVIPAFVIVTVLWIAFSTREAASTREAVRPLAWRQIILAALAFPIWVIGTTDPLKLQLAIDWWDSRFAAAALPVGAVLLPIVDGILQRLGIRQD